MNSMDPRDPEDSSGSGPAEVAEVAGPAEVAEVGGPTEVGGPAEVAGLRSRRAGRVILLDPGDRVLLLRYDDEPPNGRHWATPGGGLNPGEAYAAAASRELTEETGWSDIALLGEIHRHVRTMGYGDRIVRQHERLFLARTDLACRELGDVAPMHASDGIVAWRWWTLEELDTTAEVIWPAGLAGLIRGALRRG
jgi:ADP-ribose pyrophosphatase YjhB (NUDIX family)